MAAAGTFDYDLFGLRVRSDIALSELTPARGDGEPDVELREIKLPAAARTVDVRFAIIGKDAVINVPDAGRYLIREGREICFERVPAGSDRNLRLYLLGSAFGALLHQRALLPLHANAMDIGGRAVAFMGRSGAGKSTMAAWFHDAGYEVLADDVCVVKCDDGLPLMAYPGIPRLRLWADALAATGRDKSRYEQSFDDMDKYTVPTEPAPERRPLELAAIYLLDTDRTAEQFQVSQLTGIEALDAVMANTYRGAYVPLLGRSEQLLASALKVTANIPIYKARRVWGRDRFDEQMALLAGHARKAVSA